MVMRLYVDTSALVKTIHPEAETAALNAFLTEHTRAGTILSTSSLTGAEMERGLRALAERHHLAPERPLSESVDRALQGLVELPVNGAVLRLARWVGPPLLRTLDAIHLATAILDGADGIVAYDHRLADGAKAAHLATHRPT
jgi:predicted nucleic acid-binding protein